MRYCASCGAENANDSLFCSKCGTKLADATEEVKTEVAEAEAVTENAVVAESAAESVAEAEAVTESAAKDAVPSEPEVRTGGSDVKAEDPVVVPVVPVSPVQPADQAQQYGSVQTQQYGSVPPQSVNGVQGPNTAGDQNVKPRVFGIVGFICGIISIVFCWLGVIPIAGLVSALFIIAHGVVGLIFCIKSQREMPDFTLAKVGKIFSIIGLSLSALLWIIGIIITASTPWYLYY